MHAQAMAPTIILQPRKSLRKYIYDFYAYIIDEDQIEDIFGKGGSVSIDKDLAKSKAIWEALERYSGSHINKNVTRATFDQVKNKALNPTKVLYFNENYHSDKEFPYIKFDPNIPIDWISAYSHKDRKDILVPCQMI